MVGKKAVLMLVLLSLGMVAGTLQPAQSVKTVRVNPKGLAEGVIVSSLSIGAGISDDPIIGSVPVSGCNPDSPSTISAMIFGASFAWGSLSGDYELEFPTPAHGLINSEDQKFKDPEEADKASLDRSRPDLTVDLLLVDRRGNSMKKSQEVHVQ
jgi:hypothetical protein